MAYSVADPEGGFGGFKPPLAPQNPSKPPLAHQKLQNTVSKIILYELGLLLSRAATVH